MSTYSFENQDQTELEANFKFDPLSFSWVALHPKPKGIIQFIGGAFFGSFPTIFYHHCLNELFKEGYTVIALPFRFTFNHWSVSLQLLREQYVLRKEIVERAIALQYDSQIYLDDTNYYWVGHSLGCKYILLLELLSGFEEPNTDGLDWEQIWQQIKPNLPSSKNISDRHQIEDKKERDSRDKIEKQLENLKDKVKDIYEEWLKTKKAIEQLVKRGVDLKGLFIRNQPSLLIASDISDTESAIPIRQVATFIDRLGLGAKPTRNQTQLLVQSSSLFSITALLSFNKDMIAGNQQNSTGDSDVAWLINTLKAKDGNNPIQEIEKAYHLEPHGHQVGNYVVDFPGSIIVWSTGLAFAPFSRFSPPAKAFFNEVRKPILKTLADRKILEQTIVELLQKLKI